jgi:cobalt-zinc-cadmium efflux system membrane fusion protein
MIAVIVLLATAFGFSISHWLMPRQTPLPPVSAPPAVPEKPSASSNEASTEVKIPTAYLSAANIAVEAIVSGGVNTEILAPAIVAATPGGEATVVARASGTIIRINRQTGEAVRAGEVLALVDSLEAASMSAERSIAAAKVDLARKNYTREANLYKQGVTPRQDMEAAQSALAVAEAEAKRAASVMRAAHVTSDGRSVSVVSPISGKITAKTAILGAFVQPQTELFRVARSDAVQIEASVTATDISRIAAGTAATIISTNNSPIKAVVQAVTPTVSGNTRTATVILKPESSSSGLIIGEGVQVRLHAQGGSSDGMSVPEEAVQNIDNHDVLFIRTAQGFVPQPVMIGTRSGGLAQIISGVKNGQQVATRNAFLIKAEMIKSAKGDE